MKSPPLSPYGVFAGQLFQYSTNPSLVAFESSPPIAALNLIQSGQITSQASNKCILLGGLSDGPIPTPYTKLLEEKCHSLGWSLVQPILSSSYLGFGHGSLSRDTDELARLMEYLVCHHSAERFALVGHSTGCQNSIHFLKCGRRDLVDRLKVVALQAPVSDRESLTMTPGDHSTHLTHAQSLLSQGKGEEMMPRNAFWAPITASRYLSLFNVNGSDDFFSSDMTDEELYDRLGHVGNVGGETGLRLLAAFSKKDEYVPTSVEKDVLLKRLVSAMNGFDEEDQNGGNETAAGRRGRVAVASGLMLENGNHNLSEGEGDKVEFVQAVGKLMESAVSTDG
mmetsp:Transcript_1272/g.2703  ORF Transcript_1272/g.2703 Transcript_1272/m.2703 type:complete len:338 (-) Transcript_1272:179-1192(-)